MVLLIAIAACSGRVGVFICRIILITAKLGCIPSLVLLKIFSLCCVQCISCSAAFAVIHLSALVTSSSRDSMCISGIFGGVWGDCLPVIAVLWNTVGFLQKPPRPEQKSHHFQLGEADCLYSLMCRVASCPNKQPSALSWITCTPWVCWIHLLTSMYRFTISLSSKLIQSNYCPPGTISCVSLSTKASCSLGTLLLNSCSDACMCPFTGVCERVN